MKKSKQILLIDDEKNMHYSFKRIFNKHDFQFTSCYNGEEGLKQICEKDWDLVIMDIKMPKIDGLTILKQAKEKNPKLVVIIVTAHGTTETAIEAMKLGAYDYLVKPFNNEELKSLILKALDDSERMRENVEFSEVGEFTESKEVIVGKSPKMQAVYKTIGQVAEQDINILITGESGTGKELIALAIYTHSKRRKAPLLTVNCAAIPENLLETELFGHEKGSFTGAISQHIGKFEKSNGGTLFLDEIGDMNFSLQAKLLRVLQTGEFERVGGNRLLRTNVRIIAATNKNLHEEVKKNQFREDLYYRLNVINIQLPPLRERKDDITILTNLFMQKYCNKYDKQLRKLTDKALQKLQEYNYPGNVRELENIINRAIIVSTSDYILETDINFNPPISASLSEFKKDFHQLMDKIFENILEVPETSRHGIFPIIEEILIKKALEKVKGNQVRASKLLGISRNTLRNRIERFDL